MPRGEQFARYYPGLIPIETELWRLWLRDHEAEYQAFEYDVHVGEGLTMRSNPALGLDPELEERQRIAWQRATQKKIDVVGYRSDSVWIFEVEDRPGTRALGQILTYRTLLTKQRDIAGPIELALICRRLGTDMLEVFDEAGVIVWQQIKPGELTRGRE